MLSFLKRLGRAGSRRPRGQETLFHSDFGGLWIDRVGAAAELARRIAAGQVSPETGANIGRFMENGYVVLPGAVASAAADRLADIVATAFARGDRRLRYQTDGSRTLVLKTGDNARGARIVEAHTVLPEARDVLSAPRVLEFLSAIFDEPPVLSQSLIFRMGSEQPLHQDPAFVVYDRPLCMAACWIALEDIAQGSGELRYRIKSHRLPDYVFSTGRRDSHGARDGEVEKFLEWLGAECDSRGLEQETFLARKGDVLVWHADLAHGGSQITDPGATRQSLVGHFCPVSVRPRYALAKVRRRDGPLWYWSYFHDAIRAHFAT